MSILRSILAGVIAAIVVAGLPAPVDASPAIPSQEEWRAAKRTLELPNGQRVAYLDLGDPDEPVLVLLHGFTDTSRAWSLVAGELARHRRLIIPDLRGHGDSSRPECCYAYADMAGDVIALADELGVRGFDLAGHSMGSLIAQRLAVSHPGRVITVALLGSTALPPLGPGDELEAGILGVRAPLDPAIDPFLADWVKQVEIVPPRPAFSARVREEILAVPAGVWHRLGSTFRAAPVGAELASIRTPVLTLSGSADPLFGPKHIAALHAALPNATHCVLTGGGHNQPYEAPVWTAERMIAFLQDKRASADCRTGGSHQPEPALEPAAGRSVSAN